jgi:hypothetical protein
MTVPLSRKIPGIEKTILSTKQAIMTRLEKRGWAVREGIPRPRALPEDGAQRISVWVFPQRTETDQEGQSSNWHTEIFATTWLITIVTDDTSNDRHESSMDRIVHAASEVLEALTTTMDDITFDGNINWTDGYRAQYGIMDVGGDRSCLTCVITLQAHHPLFPTRVPPIHRQ